MLWSKKGYRKRMIPVILFTALFFVEGIISLVLGIMNGTGVLYFIFVISLLIAAFFAFVGVVWHGLSKAIQGNSAQIEPNYQFVRRQLEDAGFKGDEHVSSFGYAWLDYRNDYQARDNIHLEIDRTSRRLAYYVLIPESEKNVPQSPQLQIISFDKVLSSEIKVKKYQKKSAGTPVADVFLDPSALDTGKGGERTAVSSVSVEIHTADGVISFPADEHYNNLRCFTDSEKYRGYLQDARRLNDLIREVVLNTSFSEEKQ